MQHEIETSQQVYKRAKQRADEAGVYNDSFMKGTINIIGFLAEEALGEALHLQWGDGEV